MSTSRHIDKICAAAAVLALLAVLLLMGARILGGTAVTDGGEDGLFTADDLDGAWDADGAVGIALTGDGAEIDGYGAYFYDGAVHIVSAGRYVLSGSLTDGGIVVEATNSGEIRLLLDGINIHCEDGAALLVEQAEKVILTLAEGAENVLSSGAAYSEAAISAGIDGAIYARDDLTVNGGGALTVEAAYQHGIVCNDDFIMTGGAVSVTAVQDGIHAHDSARFCGMDLTISAGDDGVTVSNDEDTGYFYMTSGVLTIPSCYEGVEAIEVTVAGGKLDISPTDDGLNASGGGEAAIRITGGEIRIVNSTGRDADGLDSNGSIYISGGSTLASVSGSGGNCAIDYGSENGGVCQISGGTVVAAGGSMMAESFDGSSTQGFLSQTVSGAAGAALELRDEAGNTLLAAEIPCAFTHLALSAPGMTTGDVCVLSLDGEETEVVIDSADSGSAGRFGGGMTGGPGADMFGSGGFGGQRDTEDGRPDMPGEDGDTAPDMPAGGFGPGFGGQMPEDGQMPENGQTPPEGGQMPGNGQCGNQATEAWRSASNCAGETQPRAE